MSKIGIVLDAWKLTIFKRRLKQAGFSYEVRPGTLPDMKTMVVYTDNVGALAEAVRKASTEAVNVSHKDTQ